MWHHMAFQVVRIGVSTVTYGADVTLARVVCLKMTLEGSKIGVRQTTQLTSVVFVCFLSRTRQPLQDTRILITSQIPVYKEAT